MSGTSEPRPGAEAAGREHPVVGVAAADRAVREGVCALLASAGFRCRSFARVESVVEEPGREPLHWLVLDLDGLEAPDPGTLDRLRGRHPSIRLIAVASCPDARTAAVALRAGTVHLLEKPFPPEALLDRLDAVPAGRQPL